MNMKNKNKINNRRKSTHIIIVIRLSLCDWEDIFVFICARMYYLGTIFNTPVIISKSILRSGSVLVERSHLIADFNPVRIRADGSQVILRLEELAAIQ